MRIHHRTHLITMITLLCSALVAVAACTPADEVPGPGSGQVVEATIERIHAAMQAGELTSRQLVEAYLARDRRLRQAGTGAQRHRYAEPRGAGARRRARRRARIRGTRRTASRHPDDRQGQLRYRRHANKRRVSSARGLLTSGRRLPGAANTRPAPSSWPSPIWQSGPSLRTRPWAASSPATRATPTR